MSSSNEQSTASRGAYTPSNWMENAIDARAWVLANDVPNPDKKSCEGCAQGRYDAGGWYGCTKNYPCFPGHATSQDLYDAIVLELDGNDGVVWPFLAAVCPVYQTFQDAFANAVSAAERQALLVRSLRRQREPYGGR